jgi:uncharacterized protein (DUF1330 family)
VNQMPINPTQTQSQAVAELGQDEPVIFLNCHKYHARAQYSEDYDNAAMPADVSGLEAYHRYLWSVEADFMSHVGGRFLLIGPVELVLIGEGDWDEVVIGEYPSKAEAFRMQTLPGYSDITVHRDAGLANAMTLALSQSQLARLTDPGAWANRVGLAGQTEGSA